MSIVLAGGDDPTLERVAQSIRLRWPLASITPAASGAEVLEMAVESEPDLVLIHTDFQDMLLQVLIEELRRSSSIPILVLARDRDDTEAVTVLGLGADDYFQFPCGTWQLVARVWAALRRAGRMALWNDKRSLLISGRLFIDAAGAEVFLDDQKVHLTPTEFQLLYLLAKNHGNVVSHQTLEQEIRSNRRLSIISAKKHIQRLRWKLEDDAGSPSWIASVYGVGYRFVGPRPRWQEPYVSV